MCKLMGLLTWNYLLRFKIIQKMTNKSHFVFLVSKTVVNEFICKQIKYEQFNIYAYHNEKKELSHLKMAFFH